jgi:hypothetical protein
MSAAHRVIRWLPLVVGGLVFATSQALAQATPKDIRGQIDAVATLLKADKPDEAAASLAAAIEGLRAMQTQPRPPAGFKVLADKAAAARGALEKAGVDVTLLEIPGPAGGAGAPAGRAVAGGRPQPVAGVSFTRQVAPLLVKSCGGCHVSGRRGNFQMASYEALMRSGMVQKGAGNASRLVEVILSGDMPRGGGRVSPDEVGMLMAWINSGATCDADPTAGLELVARGGGAAPPPAQPVMPAAQPAPLKPGDVAFSTEIAPLLLDQCGNCHGEQTAEANFRMTSLETLVKGGRGGPAIVPGKGAESLLVKKLRGVGIDGQRMPLNRPPLSDAQIAVIEKWIDQGGRIDLLTARANLDAVAAAGRAARLSGDQLAAIRFAAAEKLWDRIIPDDPPVVVRRQDLLLVGNVPKARLDALAAEAEALAGEVAKELGGADGLLKGGVVLYAFRNAFDYSALWQVILGGERPRGLAGHAGRSGDVVYGAMLVPAADDSGDDTRLLVAEQLAAAALAGRGLPAWFVQGAGRAVAVKLVPKAPLAQAWKRETGPAVKQLGSAQDFLAGHADPAAIANAAGGFVTSLAGAGKLAQLVALVDGGGSFEDSFAKVFRSPPAQAVTTWAARAGGR